MIVIVIFCLVSLILLWLYTTRLQHQVDELEKRVNELIDPLGH